VSALIDNFLPWLGDLLELGGPILGMILLIAFAMWWLLFERAALPAPRTPAASWPKPRRMGGGTRTPLLVCGAVAQRTGRPSRSRLTQHFSLIGTLIKVCPLLGLLGTVIGMLEVFDALAATGVEQSPLHGRGRFQGHGVDARGHGRGDRRPARRCRSASAAPWPRGSTCPPTSPDRRPPIVRDFFRAAVDEREQAWTSRRCSTWCSSC
jgi:hypothetical protein